MVTIGEKLLFLKLEKLVNNLVISFSGFRNKMSCSYGYLDQTPRKTNRKPAKNCCYCHQHLVRKEKPKSVENLLFEEIDGGHVCQNVNSQSCECLENRRSNIYRKRSLKATKI